MKIIAMVICGLLLAAAPASAHQAVARAVTQNDLKNLHIFMEAASAESGKLPDRAGILAALKNEKSAGNLVKLIKDGMIVVPGTGNREDVWAYDKSAPENGGLMLTSNGIERVSAADIKKRLGK